MTEKSPWGEIFQKILFWAKWQILVQLWSKITQACISGSVLKIFLKLCHLAQQLDKNHFYLKIFPKSPSLSQVGTFGPVIVKTFPILYLRIHAKNTFQTLQYCKTQKVDKNHSSEIPPKFLLWSKWTTFG